MSHQPLEGHNIEHIADEHVNLRALLEEIRETLSRQEATCAAVAARLAELSEDLFSHFAHEEEGGYFSEVISVAPRLKDEVDSLLEQHPRLRQHLEQMLRHTEGGTPSKQWWDEAQAQFEEFTARLVEHEKRENALLQEAFSRDVGTAD